MLVKLMLFSAIMIVLGVFVPHLLMVYEVKSGLPYVALLVCVWVMMGVIIKKANNQTNKEAEHRRHMEESSLYSD